MTQVMPDATTPANKTFAKKTIKAKAVKRRGIRQTMSDLHIWTGLLVGWLLYAMFLTGTVAYFKEEMTRYMMPELAAASPPPAAQTAQRVLDQIRVKAPEATQVSITLPTERKPFVSAFWVQPSPQGNRFTNGTFDAHTGDALQTRATRGGEFFFRLHFNFHYIPVIWGRWIAGLCAMFMLVAIISGVITHKKIFVDFFTFRWGKGQRAWLDAHAGLSVLGLPFHFMITWSGLITLMFLYMPFGLQALPDAADRNAVTSEIRFFVPPGKPAGQAAPLLPVGPLVEQAEVRWGEGGVGAIQVTNPGDASAQVYVVRQQAHRVSTTPQYVMFDGVSGELAKVKDGSGPAAETQGVLYGLHLGRFADVVTRWLYFLVSLGGTAMVATGLVLWTVKRRAKLPVPAKPYFGFRLVERFNIAAIAGLSVAMTSYFWFNRLLPLDLAGRAAWEVNGFFMAWAAALVWALVRPAKRAWVELFWLAAILLAGLPVLNVLTTDRHLFASLRDGDWVFAGFDLTMLVFAAVHACLAIRTARHKPRAKPVSRKPRAAPSGQQPGPGTGAPTASLTKGENAEAATKPSTESRLPMDVARAFTGERS